MKTHFFGRLLLLFCYSNLITFPHILLKEAVHSHRR